MKLSKFYDLLSRINNQIIYKYVYKFLKVYVNVFFPKFARIKDIGVDETSPYIVSLTSFPARIGSVWITVLTLLRQTVKPSKIILWLGSDEFEAIEKLPKKLLDLQRYGLEIRFCDNLYPHKKYYYSMLEYSSKMIITVDDDIFYPETLIEQLDNCHKNYPGCVACNWAHMISFSENETINPYDLWESGTSECGPSMKLLAVGFGGVLYPRNVMHEDVFKKEVFMKICPKTDDLWLKCMSALNDVKVVRVRRTPVRYFSILSTQKSALTFENVYDRKNDVAMKLILQEYPEVLEHIKK